MSRALGDLQYKTPVNTVQEDDWVFGARRASSSSTPVRGDFLSNEPYTSRRTLREDRRYLLAIVSDGVTDRTDDAGLIRHVMKSSMRGMRARDIAQDVATKAASHPRSDNTSCIVAMIDGRRS